VIIFKKVRWQNLLSTGNAFTEINLCDSPSTLIVGENGSGKSTFIEAISFALYGKPFRKINKPQLVNSINKKNLVAEIEFSIGSKEYLVRRGINPVVFQIFIDGNMINQEAAAKDYQEMLEKNILKLTHKSFSQIITLGTSTFIPFMQLPAQQRREFIEDLLDIQIFTTMNVLLKEKVQKNKSEIVEVNHSIDMLQQKIELSKKHIESMRQNNQSLIAQKMDKINYNNSMIEELDKELGKLEASQMTKRWAASEGINLAARKKKLVQIKSDLQSKSNNIVEHLEFFKEHDNCPTCTQDISTDFKDNFSNKNNQTISEINEAINKLSVDIKELEVKLDGIRVIKEEIESINQSISGTALKIDIYQKQVVDLLAEKVELETKSEKIDTEANDETSFVHELEEKEKLKEELIHTRSLLNVAAQLLKDGGIKTKIIKQYVPIINKLINKYLASMDFFVQFELDENFNEKLRSRFRDEFSYGSFSEGEKMRIDLALLFTWRAVSKLRNSASTNLLIMDEVFDSSLDTSGTEEFFKILSGVASDTNVFIISHKGDALADKFSNIIKFEKQKNFSRISE